MRDGTGWVHALSEPVYVKMHDMHMQSREIVRGTALPPIASVPGCSVQVSPTVSARVSACVAVKLTRCWARAKLCSRSWNTPVRL